MRERTREGKGREDRREKVWEGGREIKKERETERERKKKKKKGPLRGKIGITHYTSKSWCFAATCLSELGVLTYAHNIYIVLKCNHLVVVFPYPPTLQHIAMIPF